MNDKPVRPTVNDKPARPTVNDKPARPTVKDKPARPTVNINVFHYFHPFNRTVVTMSPRISIKPSATHSSPTHISSSSQQYCMEVKHGAWKKGQISMVGVICGEYLKGGKRYTDLMFMLGLNEKIDQLAIANSVCRYDHVLRREDGHVLRRAFHFEVEDQRKKWRPKRTWKKQVEEESVKVGLRMEDVLCRSKWSVDVNRIAAGSR